MAVFFHGTKAEQMPSRFSWRREVGGPRSATHPELSPGVYACDAMDQHAPSWCGACYLVAAATSVSDRAHIALARAHHGRCVRPPRLSLQTLLDHFREWSAEPGWNACHGGFPLSVLRCMQDRTCPMVWEERADAWEWWGFPRALTRCPVPDVTSFRVAGARRVPPETVKRELLEHGPLVLEVSARTLKTLDARGVATDLTPRPPDHAVCVVGWETTADGVECWVVRNSWGDARAPKAVPTDITQCVARGRNACAVEWEPWRGMPSDPGFLLLPMRFAPLSSRTPSPWIAARVVVA